jgi:hypothetical protein
MPTTTTTSTTTSNPAPTFLQDLELLPTVALAIAGDIETFSAGSSVPLPSIPLSSNANGKTELQILIQKVTVAQPLNFGNLTSFLGELLLEFVTGQQVALPPFTERIGSTIVQISATIVRVPTVAAA